MEVSDKLEVPIDDVLEVDFDPLLFCSARLVEVLFEPVPADACAVPPVFEFLCTLLSAEERSEASSASEAAAGFEISFFPPEATSAESCAPSPFAVIWLSLSVFALCTACWFDVTEEGVAEELVVEKVEESVVEVDRLKEDVWLIVPRYDGTVCACCVLVNEE